MIIKQGQIIRFRYSEYEEVVNLIFVANSEFDINRELDDFILSSDEDILHRWGYGPLTLFIEYLIDICMISPAPHAIIEYQYGGIKSGKWELTDSCVDAPDNLSGTNGVSVIKDYSKGAI